MLKALLKKQFMELVQGYFKTRNGERRTGKSLILVAVLFAFLFIFLGVTFYYVAAMIIEPFSKMGLTWLYFVIMGLLAVLLGTFGSVFNTFTMLYKAKDNEFLLSLPITPFQILFVRLVGVYVVSLIYESLVFIPTLIAYFILGAPTFAGVVTAILTLFLLAFFISALTCLLGWGVAFVSTKLKSKSIVTVIIALAFFGVYYYVCLNFVDIVEKLVNNAVIVGESVKNSAYPLYAFGIGVQGSLLEFVIVSLCFLALFALTCFILSKTFIKIVTKTQTEKKKAVNRSDIKQISLQKTLFKKEWKRFISNANYILNCSLGVVFMVLIAVGSLIYMNDIRVIIKGFAEELPNINNILPMIIVFAGAFMSSMNMVSAPSIALEGKNIWVLQVLPVDSKNVLKAKLYVHYLVNLPFIVLFTICLSIATEISVLNAILVLVVLTCLVMLNAGLGLVTGLLKPNLHWVNEAYAIKQGASVLICMLFAMVSSFVIALLGYFGAMFMSAWVILLIISVLLMVAIYFMYKWLFTKGAEIFATLS